MLSLHDPCLGVRMHYRWIQRNTDRPRTHLYIYLWCITSNENPPRIPSSRSCVVQYVYRPEQTRFVVRLDRPHRPSQFTTSITARCSPCPASTMCRRADTCAPTRGVPVPPAGREPPKPWGHGHGRREAATAAWVDRDHVRPFCPFLSKKGYLDAPTSAAQSSRH
jgi:hypothetical protein